MYFFEATKLPATYFDSNDWKIEIIMLKWVDNLVFQERQCWHFEFRKLSNFPRFFLIISFKFYCYLPHMLVSVQIWYKKTLCFLLEIRLSEFKIKIFRINTVKYQTCQQLKGKSNKFVFKHQGQILSALR